MVKEIKSKVGVDDVRGGAPSISPRYVLKLQECVDVARTKMSELCQRVDF